MLSLVAAGDRSCIEVGVPSVEAGAVPPVGEGGVPPVGEGGVPTRGAGDRSCKEGDFTVLPFFGFLACNLGEL
jgi:hypothetical protein